MTDQMAEIPAAVEKAARELQAYDSPVSVAAIADCAWDMLDWTCYLEIGGEQEFEVYATIQATVLAMFDRGCDADRVSVEELVRVGGKVDFS